jgi:hypothetical protein
VTDQTLWKLVAEASHYFHFRAYIDHFISTITNLSTYNLDVSLTIDARSKALPHEISEFETGNEWTNG